MTLLMQTALPCEVHKAHTPRSHINEKHHVWPLGHGGPDIPTNLVVVCATGHNNIHRLLELMLRGNGQVAYPTLRQFTTGERQYARLGYDRIRRKAM